jgi:hypothetical protein
MSNLENLRPNYNDVIGDSNDLGDVVFSDQMNKFIDDLIAEITQKAAGDVAIRMGNRISGDGSVTFGSRV